MAGFGEEGELVVAYWSIRGLGAPLRMLACYSGHPRVNLLNHEAGNPSLAGYKQHWFNEVKPELLRANALMNLPYVIDTDAATGERIVVVQTNACLCYLGEKFGLAGQGAAQRARVQQVLCETMDLRNKAVAQFYSGGDQQRFDAGLDAYLEKVRGHLAKLDGFMVQNGTAFSAADTLTMADFHLFEMLDQNEILVQRLGRPSLLTDYPKLRALHIALRAEPKLAGYFASAHSELPINNPHAVFR